MFSLSASLTIPSFADVFRRRKAANLELPPYLLRIDRRLRKAIIRLIRTEATHARPDPMDTTVFYGNNDKAQAYMESSTFQALLADANKAGWVVEIHFHPTAHGLYVDQAGQFALVIRPKAV